VKVAVVIPYFQRSPGVLRATLESVFRQELPAGAELDVIVVDDASPLDPATDVRAAGAAPAGVSIRIVRRPNGGPGAARNTGLDAVTPDTDFVALVDSDDTWRADHLQRALTTLAEDADVYFSNHLKDGETHMDLARSKFLRDWRSRAVRSVELDGSEVLVFEGLVLADYTAEEFLAHLSSIVFRVPRLGGVRFEEKLRVAGEDCVFFFDLALGARRVCCSLSIDVERGSGISIHDGTFEWGSDRDFRRRMFNLAALKMMRKRMSWPAHRLKRIGERLFIMRREAGFLLTRAFGRRVGSAGPLIDLAWRLDRSVAALAPIYALLFMVYRLRVGRAGIDGE
jgi:succinoglycan biosynthesis protein ExoW